MKTLSIDIETYSDQNLAKTGVYRYVESPVFQILLFSYSVDGGPVQLVDLACGEEIPAEVLRFRQFPTVHILIHSNRRTIAKVPKNRMKSAFPGALNPLNQSAPPCEPPCYNRVIVSMLGLQGKNASPLIF